MMNIINALIDYFYGINGFIMIMMFEFILVMIGFCESSQDEIQELVEFYEEEESYDRIS